jgi:hypothetical protein
MEIFKMHKNGNANAIDMNCFCGSIHCHGNIFIQSDTINNKKCLMISATDTSGDEDADLWISYEQAEQLAKELKILIKENK